MVANVLKFIKCNTKFFTSFHCLRSLYFILVWSILEFGALKHVAVWNPYLIKDKLRLNQVQNRFIFFTVFTLKVNVPIHDYEKLYNFF